MAYLALIRHGESEWNALDMWTGWDDISITEKGRRQAREVGLKLRGIKWDLAFQSDLKRSHETLDEIKSVLGQPDLETITSVALKERDYGNFAGMNKVEVEVKYGEDLFNKWHRGWDYPLPHGETLKDVYNRVIPYYLSEILPGLKEGKNTIVSAHGNSLRALVKFLEDIPDDQIHLLEIPVGKALFYEVSSGGKAKPISSLTPAAGYI